MVSGQCTTVQVCGIFQFPDTVEFCELMANKGKTVVVAALDGTFQRQVSYRSHAEYAPDTTGTAENPACLH